MAQVSKPNRSRLGTLVSLIFIAIGVAFAIGLYGHNQTRLSTDAATLDAEVVHIAPSVAGRIVELPIHENEHVQPGQLLFKIDPVSYQLAVDQAKANVAMAEAARETRRRSIATEMANADIAKAQTVRAETNLALAERTVERLAPLAAKSYVPTQEFDQAKVAKADATTSLAQARRQEAAAIEAVGSLAAADASVLGAQAALAQAQKALADTEVKAPHAGRITGLGVLSGEYVVPAQSLFTLIGTDHWFAVANIRETDLEKAQPDTCVTVYSMIDRSRPMRGSVESIGFGVKGGDRIDLPRSLPLVERSMNWVRVAQRFPVRIRLTDPPEMLVRVGASASVEIGHGASCP